MKLTEVLAEFLFSASIKNISEAVMKKIVIDIADDGQIQIENRGFTGKSCVQEAEFIKKVLGNETARKLTPAYWQKCQVQVKKYLPLCG